MAKKIVVEKLVAVYDPEDNEHMMSTSNARDKVTLDGWSYAKGAKIVNPNEIIVKEVATETKLPNEAQPNLIGADPAETEPTELDLLRIEASKLGIDFKPTWGKAKLEKAIGDLKKAD